MGSPAPLHEQAHDTPAHEPSPAPPAIPAGVRAQLVELFAQALVKDLRRDGVLPEPRADRTTVRRDREGDRVEPRP
jgi:hypothetical protein